MYTELLTKACTLTIVYTHLLLKTMLIRERLNHLENNENYILQFAVKATLYVTSQSRANVGVAPLYIYINILLVEK